MKIKYTTFSEAGVRRANQDVCRVVEIPEHDRTLMVVCDGMGGLTDDLGILHDGETCPCGLTSPWLEIVGRVGLKDIKTCAAGAGDILAASLGKEERT